MERIRRFIRELSERQWLESMELREWDITRTTYVVPGALVYHQETLEECSD